MNKMNTNLYTFSLFISIHPTTITEMFSFSLLMTLHASQILLQDYSDN